MVTHSSGEWRGQRDWTMVGFISHHNENQQEQELKVRSESNLSGTVLLYKLGRRGRRKGLTLVSKLWAHKPP